MLPTKGYFQDIDCPYYDSNCGRPYCHFRHKKKHQDSGNESPKDFEIPTYNPTPKSQLINNRTHIPISYVPDLAFRPERTVRAAQKFTLEKPTYKPTPLSLLSTVSKQTAEIKNDIDEPEDEGCIIYGNQNDECSKVVQNTSYEYNPSNGNSANQFEYTPTGDGDKSDNKYENEYTPVGENACHLQYNPTSSNDKIDQRHDTHYTPTGENQSSVEYHPSAQLDKDYDASAIDFEDFTNEFDMIDEIISDNSASIASETINDKTFEEIPEDSKCEKSAKKQCEKSTEIQCEKLPDNQREKSVDKLREKPNEKPRAKPNQKRGKPNEKSHEKVGEKHSKSKHSSSHSSSKSKDKDRERSSKSPRKLHSPKAEDKKSKNSDKGHGKGKQSSKSSLKSKDEKSHGKSKESSSSKTEKFSEKSTKSRGKSREKSNERHLEKKGSDKKVSLTSNTSSHKNHSGKHKSSDRERNKEHEDISKKKKHSDKKKEKDKERAKGKEKEGDKIHTSRYKEDDRKSYKKKNDSTKQHSDKKHESSKTKKDKNKHIKKEQESEPEDASISSGHSSPMFDKIDSIIDDIDFNFDEDDDETLRECYRIFNEYKPPETFASDQRAPQEQKQADEAENSFLIKKRIAHMNADKITPKVKQEPPSTVPNAAQVMTNRFKLAQLARASNEEYNVMNEVKQMSLKRPAPPSLTAAMKSYKIQRTLKEAQTSQKPSTSSLVDDIINHAQKTSNAVTKFPQRKIAPATNVLSMQKAKERIEEMRQKAVESAKKTVAQTQKGSKRVAHVPEVSLAELPDVLQADKSKLPVNVRTRFLTMIADECVKLYLIKEDAYSRALNEEFNCYEKCKVLVSYKNSAMLAVSRIRKEHQERVKQGLGPVYSDEVTNKGKDSEFTGQKLYNNVKLWLLTEEELDIHGFPRESRIPGKAIIKNRKSISSMPLEPYQRQCARCKKIYVVDEDGFAFYEEECLYHPLKKRTLRGEQTYLCCKSSDETGCATSHTHVSDCQDESELEGFQTTMEAESDDDPRSTAVYALDCEMCYTTKGLELTRVTIVDTECKTVYETLVKPLNPVIDYNTRFSGITKEQMDRTSTSILQVQANILHLCNSETILIGHSLESDMKALKIVHGTIIDTSVIFPHRMGLPHKRALKALASEFLKKIIQNDISGHDSAEDAITCMELIKWKLKEEVKGRGGKQYW